MKRIKYFLMFILLIGLCVTSFAQNLSGSNAYPIILNSDTLFFINNNIGTFSAKRRAEEINKNISILAKDDTIDYKLIRIKENLGNADVLIKDKIIFTITDLDAANENLTAFEMAKNYRNILEKKLLENRIMFSKQNLIYRILYQLGYILGFILLTLGISKLTQWFYKKIDAIKSKNVLDVKFNNRVIVGNAAISNILRWTIKGLRITIVFISLYYLIVLSLQNWPQTRNLRLEVLVKNILLVFFYSVMYFAIRKGINLFNNYLNSNFIKWKDTKIKSIKIKSVEILSADRTVELLTFMNRGIKFILHISLIYVYITILFSLFEFSSTWSDKLLKYILNPLNVVWNSFINFLPNLFFVIVLVYVFKYIIRAVKFIFTEIEAGNIEFPNFHKEWAIPTYKIVRFLIMVLAAIVIFPYLPGSDSPFFQGISVFLGILFSLGSSTAIGNMVAGIVLTYTRAFKIGDRVKIADTIGDVIEKTLLVTRIRTIKNVNITIPNAMVLGSHIINYSTSSQEKGLILHTTVTIGYDVPWRKVHELLIASASEVENILSEPEPFVLQKSLDDFYVSYELNAYTNKPNMMARIYSDLHSKIQDKFNEAGVEIMSPHYGAMRDGNQIAIPEEYLSKDYKAPGFNILGINLFGRQNNKEKK